MIAGKAVVIGSGLTGVTTAILMAEAGWQVTLLERHAITGGLMQRYRRGGRWFDTGFHLATAAGPNGPLRAILRRLGTLEQHRFLAPDPDAQFHIVMPGTDPIRLPIGLRPTAAAAAAHWPQQRAQILAFFELLLGHLAANGWLQGLADGAVAVASNPELSVAQALDRCGVVDEPKRMLGSACSILAMHPDTCPFDLYVGFAGSSFAGGWRLAGGGDGLIRPLLARAAQLGVEIQDGCGAKRIRHEGSVAQAVIDDADREHPVDLVVAAIHPDEVVRLTGPEGFRPGFKARMAEVPDGDGAFIVAAALDRRAVELGRSHHLLRLPDGRDCYLVAPDQWEEGLEPTLEAMVWVPVADLAPWRSTALGRRSDDYLCWKQTQCDLILQVIAERFPAVRSSITRIWTASPLTFRDYTGGRHGGAMGLSHDLGHLGSTPISPRNKLRNLLLTGQSVHHPGILGSLIGGCVTAGAIIGRDVRAEVFAAQTS